MRLNRFTFLRNNAGDGSNPAQRQRELQQQQARNRRLAMQMERRPAVMAALKIKKRSLRQRLGLAGTGLNAAGIDGGLVSRGGGLNNIKDRLSLGRVGRKLGRGVRRGQLQGRRGRQRGGPAGGVSALGSGVGGGRLSRSQSMQSINSQGKFPKRARSRSRSRSRVRANSISGSTLNLASNSQRFQNKRGGLKRGAGRFIQRNRQGGRGRGGQNFRGRGGSSWGGGRGRRGGLDFRGRGRGVRGIRGRRGNRGRGANRGRRDGQVPTKEELDNQLDQYMANTRYGLDKDLDTYMKEANSLGTSSASTSKLAAEESWD